MLRLATALLLMLWTHPALAALPGTEVDCAYDRIAPEDRESVKKQVVASLAKPGGPTDEEAREMSKLFDANITACAKEHGWSEKRGMWAVQYTYLRLFAEGMTQKVQDAGKSVDIIDLYLKNNPEVVEGYP